MFIPIPGGRKGREHDTASQAIAQHRLKQWRYEKRGEDIMTIRSPDPKRVAGSLNALCPPHGDHDSKVLVSVKNANEHIMPVATALNEQDIRIHAIPVRTPEDVFLSFTGRICREKDADASN